MLTDAQLKEYDEQGFVIVHDFLNADEVKALQVELARFEREGLGHNVNPSGAVNYQVIPLDTKSELIRAMLFHEKILACLKQLFGTEDIYRWLDQIFLKPANHGSGTEWHQDNAYFRVPDPKRGMGLWIAMHDASTANGTMEVIPNSEGVELEYTRSEGSDHHIAAQGVDETGATPVEVKAGGVVFFNFGILHCTRANTTDRPRAGLAFHYMARDGVEDQAEADENRTILSGQGCTGGEKEYGHKVAGTWEDVVRETIATEAAV